MTSNSCKEYPLSSDKLKYLGKKAVLCGLPVIDQSAKRYNDRHSKPIMLSSYFSQYPGIKDSDQTTYTTDYIHRESTHMLNYHENPADVMAMNPNSAPGGRFWATQGGIPRQRENKHQRGSGIPGLETYCNGSLLNYIRHQKPKEIVGDHPREVIPKRTDMRHQRKYRWAYLDPELVTDSRHKYRLQPPNVAPALTAKQVANLLVSPKSVEMQEYIRRKGVKQYPCRAYL